MAARSSGARFIGLSGLITPSLSEMCAVASRLEEEGLHDISLFVGGATTSALHTAVKIAPLFGGLTLHTGDAAPAVTGTTDLRIPVGELKEKVNWREFLHTWHISPALAAEALRDHSEGCECR